MSLRYVAIYSYPNGKYILSNRGLTRLITDIPRVDETAFGVSATAYMYVYRTMRETRTRTTNRLMISHAIRSNILEGAFGIQESPATCLVFGLWKCIFESTTIRFSDWKLILLLFFPLALKLKKFY